MSMIPTPHVVHVLYGRIIGLKNEISRNALALGGALAEMRDRDLYRELGYPTFEDYLVSDEVRMHRTTAYSFMRIYQSFHLVEREAIKLDWRKLDILTQIIKEGESPERILPMLEQAAAMPREELRAGVRAGKQQRMIAPTVSTFVDTVPAPIGANYVVGVEADETSLDRGVMRQFPALVAPHQSEPEAEPGAYSRYALLEQYNGAIGRVLTAARYAKDLYRHTPSGDMAAHLTDQEESDDDAIILDFTEWVRSVILARQGGVKVRRVK